MSPRERLVDQLPRTMAEDQFLRRFLHVFEDVSDTVAERIDVLDCYLDVGLAPIEFVRWMGAWLGVAVDPTLPEPRQRELVRAAGQLHGRRGTRAWLERMLGALTGALVEVTDSGGVFEAGRAPAARPQVTIEMEHDGGLGEQRLLAFVHGEVPADATVTLEITGPVPDSGSRAAAAATAAGADHTDDDEGFLPPLFGGANAPGTDPSE